MAKKQRLINFRVTEEEFHLLHQKAAAENITVGRYVRDAVLPDPKRVTLEARVSRLEELAGMTHVFVAGEKLR